jgi:hypothetical protein
VRFSKYVNRKNREGGKRQLGSAGEAGRTYNCQQKKGTNTNDTARSICDVFGSDMVTQRTVEKIGSKVAILNSKTKSVREDQLKLKTMK